MDERSPSAPTCAGTGSGRPNCLQRLGRAGYSVNNAAVQYPQNSMDIQEQLLRTFESNFFSYFYGPRRHFQNLHRKLPSSTPLPLLPLREPHVDDYSATKGAIVAFTRSMAPLVTQGLRVNAVAPGPVWTPLIVSSFSPEKVQTFGSTTPMQRAAQPYELAPIYVFLACEDSSNVSGQIFHVNSGTIIN